VFNGAVMDLAILKCYKMHSYNTRRAYYITFIRGLEL